MNLFDLKGKAAIVTGGNGGIGLGMARGLAQAGAAVAVTGRKQDKCDRAAAQLKADYGVPTLGLVADVTDPQAVTAMVEKVEAEFGRIDILVANAGTNIRRQPEDYTVEEWDAVVNINLKGAFLCSQAVFPAMKRAGGGKVICTGSMTTLFGGAKLTPYASSKGGIVQMARCLACAWAKDNIQVNSILPGWIDTDLTRQARIDIPGLHERVLDRSPAGRWGNPADFAGIAVFLASQASDFLTGTAIPVDGGFSTSI